LIYILYVFGKRRPAALAAICCAIVATMTIPGESIRPQNLAAQADDIGPLVGTWVFVPEKSTADSTLIPFRRGTCKIQWSAGAVRITYDLVRLRGGITHLEWTGAIDGRDYAVQGIDSDVTNAYRRIDARTYEIVQKVNGAVSLVERLVVSADGNTITTTAPLRDPSGRTMTLTTVYERQPNP
jgi:hypothetical protein